MTDDVEIFNQYSHAKSITLKNIYISLKLRSLSMGEFAMGEIETNLQTVHSDRCAVNNKDRTVCERSSFLEGTQDAQPRGSWTRQIQTSEHRNTVICFPHKSTFNLHGSDRKLGAQSQL